MKAATPTQAPRAERPESVERFSAKSEALEAASVESRSWSASAPQGFASSVFFARPTVKREMPLSRSRLSRWTKSSCAMVL